MSTTHWATEEFDLFQKLSEAVVCGGAITTPQNVAAQTERLIAVAFYHPRPVYMAFPAGLANPPAVSTASPIPAPVSNKERLEAAVQAIIEALDGEESAVVLPGVMTARAGLTRPGRARGRNPPRPVGPGLPTGQMPRGVGSCQTASGRFAAPVEAGVDRTGFIHDEVIVWGRAPGSEAGGSRRTEVPL